MSGARGAIVGAVYEPGVRVAIGMDIGGSGVRAAVVRDGVVVGTPERVRLPDRKPETVLRVASELHGALGGGPLGVGVPGFVREGVVLGSPNLPDLAGWDLQSALAEALATPVAVGNDANMAALGAWRLRGATEHLVLLTLGTGVGGGVVIDGRLLVGAGGTGAEVGHIVVGGQRPCGCGGRGCLETWCGTVGLLAAARALGESPVDGHDIVRAADEGALWAQGVLAGAAEHLGKGLVTLVNLFNPDVVVLTGGLAVGRRWLEPAEKWLRRHGVPPSVDHVQVVWGGRAEHYAIVGAATLAESASRR